MMFFTSVCSKRGGDIGSTVVTLPPVSANEVLLPEPQFIFERRVIQKGKYHPKTEILVQWKGASPEDASWCFSRTYPEFGLADKDRLRGMN